MADVGIWTGIVAAGAAVSGVLVTVLADGLKELRKVNHDLRVRQLDREQAAAGRRRAFEIENLQAAYDGLWRLARESVLQHQADVKAARENGHGYGVGPTGHEPDLVATSQAKKAIRLILDDNVRRLAREAHAAMTDLSLLNITASARGTGPATVEEAQVLSHRVANAVDAAMDAIADRLRQVVSEGDIPTIKACPHQ